MTLEIPLKCITRDHRDVYITALMLLSERNIPFMLGGAFAVWFYTGNWRHTHDIDVFTVPEMVPTAAAVLAEAGFEDLGEQAPGDRNWIYHGVKEEIIVDIIWKSANRLASVTDEWLEQSRDGELLGIKVKFIPMEELVWSKIFTMNKHRCDWPDVMKIFRSNCAEFNWNRLLNILGDHWLLFAGVLDVFDWQYPADARCVPAEIRQELIKRRLEYRPEPDSPSREKLLDPWIHTRPEDVCCWEP